MQSTESTDQQRNDEEKKSFNIVLWDELVQFILFYTAFFVWDIDVLRTIILL